MNRRLLFALYASAALAVPAMAEDSFNWSGLYAGINAGYGGGQFRIPMAGTFNAPPNTYNLDGELSIDGNGFVGGGQAGYNYVFPTGWLIGFEADIQGTTINPNLSAAGPLGSVGTYNLSFGTSVDFLGTARTRFGYVMPENNLLLYGTAGLAYAGVNVDAVLHAQSATDHADATLHRFSTDLGWTAGAGVEYPVTDKLSLRAEYLYVDLGRKTVFNWQVQAPSLTGSGAMNIETTAHIGRVALNYAFN